MNLKLPDILRDTIKPGNAVFNAHETERLHQLQGVQLASFVSRLVAFFIDLVISSFIFLIVVYFGIMLLEKTGWVSSNANYHFDLDYHNWYSIVLLILYFGLFTYFSNGKTPGKWLMKIRVVSLLHEKMSLWHSIERAVGYGASALEFGFGFLQYFIHPNKRTVHDRIAETIVIKEKKPEGRQE
jgi:uncharacterized RDD family membrane protein YckC